MNDIWEPVAGTRYFTRNGKGLYERLTSRMYLRVDDLEDTDAIECFQHFGSATDTVIDRALTQPN